MASGDQWWSFTDNVTYASAGTTNVYPAVTAVSIVAPEAPVDDSPLAWLKRQILEVTALAVTPA